MFKIFKIILFIVIFFISKISLSLTNEELLNTKPIIINYLTECSKIVDKKLEYKLPKSEMHMLLLIKGKSLDTNCLKKLFNNYLSINKPANGDYIDLNIYLNRDEFGHTLITSIGRQICGEDCNLSQDTILFENSNFWYFYDLFNDYGLNVEKIDKLESKLLLKFPTGTHTKNVIYDKYSDKFTYLTDGTITFDEEYYIAEWSKGYLPNAGGAFWYSAKRDYNNKIIELIKIETVNTSCLSFDKFYEDSQISKFMKSNNIDKFCVAR